MSIKLEVFSPSIPPGLNATYAVTCRGGKARMYMRKKAVNWKKDFILIVKSEVNSKNLVINPKSFFLLKVFWWGSRHDSDAHLKLVKDAVADGCSFNDKQIVADLNFKLSPELAKEFFNNYWFFSKTGIVIILEEVKGDLSVQQFI